jgi:hypothetical protein
MDVILEHDLLRRVLEPDRRQPAPIGLPPAFLARIGPTMPEQEALQVLARLARDAHRRRPRPDQIAHRLMSLVGHPDRRQLARPMEFGQRDGIAAVGLHPIACLHRDERGGEDHAVVTQLDELPVDAVAAGAGLIAEMRRSPLAAQLLGQFADAIGAVGDRAPVAHFTASFPTRDRDRDRRLVDIQPDEHGILHPVSPPFMRPGAGMSGATLEGECCGRGHLPSLFTPRS